MVCLLCRIPCPQGQLADREAQLAVLHEGQSELEEVLEQSKAAAAQASAGRVEERIFAPTSGREHKFRRKLARSSLSKFVFLLTFVSCVGFHLCWRSLTLAADVGAAAATGRAAAAYAGGSPRG